MSEQSSIKRPKTSAITCRKPARSSKATLRDTELLNNSQSNAVVPRSPASDNVLKMRSLILLLLLVLTQEACSSKILALMTVPAHSHHQWNLVYLKALTARGHQVTYVGVDDYEKPADNISYIHIEHAYDLYGIMNFTDLSDKSLYDGLNELYDWYNMETLDFMKQNGFQKFSNVVKSEKFDLVVFDLGTISFWLGCVDLLGRPPVIGITAFGVPEWSLDFSGTPYPIQNNAHFLSSSGKNMNFRERLYNAGVFYYSKFLRSNYHTGLQTQAARTAFGSHIRSIPEIEGDITINLVNVNWATEFSFPIAPGLVPVAGLHIKPVQPLPKVFGLKIDPIFVHFIL